MRWQISVLLLLVLMCYWNTLGASFQFDDFFMLGDAHITQPGFGWSVFRLEQTRPLTYWTFHWNYLAGQLNPQGYHLVNVLLHAANVALLLLIARRHFSSFLAWLAAALFAVHPLQTEAVGYIFQRATLLATFFALLSFLFFLRERYAVSVLAFGLSLLGKEETMALPAFFLLYDIFWNRRRPILSYHIAMFGLTAVAVARLFYVLHALHASFIGFAVRGISPLTYALTESRVIWKYLGLFLWPAGLNLAHDVPLSEGLLSPVSTLPSLLALVAAVVALSWLTWKGNQQALWALGYFILLSPSSSIVPAVDVMFEHRCYFPLVCLVIPAAWLVTCLPARAAGPGVAAIIMALTVGTVARNRIWMDPIALWTDVLEKSPRRAVGYLGLGKAYADSGDALRSRQILEQGVRLHPGDARIHGNLGMALLQLGVPQEALIHFQRQLEISGESADRLTNRGVAEAKLGDVDHAIQSYRRALSLDPCYHSARVHLMLVLLERGLKADVIEAAKLPASCPATTKEVMQVVDLRRVAEQ